MLDHDTRQIADTIERLRATLDEFVVRGLCACGPEQMQALTQIRDDLRRTGASYLTEALTRVIDTASNDDAEAPAALLSAQATLRLFDRVLTLRVAETAYATMREGGASA